jgi:exodeoxyribonuclease VII large subunit
MTAAADAALERAQARVDHARSRLRLLTPSAQVERGFQRVDDLAGRLGVALRHAALTRRRELDAARSRLALASPENRVQLASHQLLALWKRLQAASPVSVLNRGFVILRDEKGVPVMRRAAVRPAQVLAAQFADGSVPLRVEPPSGSTS